MNATRTLLAAALAIAAVGPVAAQEADSDAWMNVTSTKTRAQVQDELAQARADGSIKVLSLGYLPSIPVASSKTRAEVVASVQAARRSGELDRILAEAYDFDRALPAPGHTLIVQAGR
jgi:hypothetical protein